ncbi:hypothetical protein QTO34_013763 [Cnephaeus nilssonii]|uniref:Uncharacterized protein n=1 Tax=Cnephaeus nilssonii TaxID=3371016 RepID=A0AA40LV79_CNENI|nr:hypothetical protein QTO34_013763 [Eptesicus nilssonii]
MAAALRSLGRVLIPQRHSLPKMAYQTPFYPCSACVHVPKRHFAAAAARKPEKKTKRRYTRWIKLFIYLRNFKFWNLHIQSKAFNLDLTLDMALGKKKQVKPFASVIKINKVAVFTGKASDSKIAEKHGAEFAGGTIGFRRFSVITLNQTFM